MDQRSTARKADEWIKFEFYLCRKKYDISKKFDVNRVHLKVRIKFAIENCANLHWAFLNNQ